MDSIPEKIKRARRALDSVDQVKILHDWQYDVTLKKWYLHISIQIDKSSELIPEKSQWYVVISSDYPNGEIEIFPDFENSISVTLFHQSNNARIEDNGLWKKGKLCLELNSLEIYDPEPRSVDDRLLYHVERAIDWLTAAFDDNLVSDKDSFELPDFNIAFEFTKKFVFNEDVVSFMQWEDEEKNFGIAELETLPQALGVYYIKNFISVDNKSRHIVSWGKHMSDNHSLLNNIAPWVLLKSIPVLNVWQPPETFKELKTICSSQGIDIVEVLEKTSKYLRDGKNHFFLIGFPIPKTFYGENELIFWQALYLPILSYGKYTANGFRNKENGYWRRDKYEVLFDTMTLDWIESENWNQNEISQRGRMNLKLLRKNILVIGAGCVAASVSEILVRSGVYNLTIMDMDLFEVGNLTRHTLLISEVNSIKERSLCDHLNRITPQANVEYIEEKLHLNDRGESNVDLEQYDVIIDCTGNNDVLDILSGFEFCRVHDVISVSIGLGANRLYVAMQRSKSVAFDSFFELISPYLADDKARHEDMDFPRDGTGCWHPTFPARSDDVWMAASTATKLIEKFVDNDSSTKISMVFEQQEADGYFSGYNLVNKCNG